MSSNLINELINNVKVYQDKKEIILIQKAVEFTKKAHEKQFRKSGDPYYYHPISVAKILSEIKLDNSSVICGLLHDTVEDTTATIEEIKKHFGAEIGSLVEGLTKINEYSLKINNQNFGFKIKILKINSYHNYAISQLPKHFNLIVRCSDNSIEIAKSNKYKILSFMFHPERRNISQKKINKIVFSHFKIK